MKWDYFWDKFIINLHKNDTSRYEMIKFLKISTSPLQILNIQHLKV
jgi:hypothetical protein